MELKEYIRIIKRNIKIFITIWLGTLLACFVWFWTRPVSFDASLAVEISRRDVQQTQTYQYDQYYRLEADNKFAETVVQWLKDPALVNSIYSQAGINAPETIKALTKTFRAEKLSPNHIQVRFSASSVEQAEKIASAGKESLKQQVDTLNINLSDHNWFQLVFGQTLVAASRVDWRLVAFIGLVGGLFLALTSTLIKHYWEE